MRKLTYKPTVPVEYPSPYEVAEMTENEANSPKYIFARTIIRGEIETQQKLLRRYKSNPLTARDREIESWKSDQS